MSTFIGDESRLEDITIFPEDWYEEQNISVRLKTKITAIKPYQNLVIDHTGQEFTYEKLIIATGASPFLPDLPGEKNNGVFALRNLNDALAIREAIQSKRKAVIIGGGILGIEAASSLNKSGISTTIVEMADHLMPQQLDAAAADILQKILQERGVKILCNARVKALEGNRSLSSLILDNGERLPADMVLFSTGISPNITLAKQASIQTNRGIKVNDKMETSSPNIFAAGDVTEHINTLHGIWPAAVDQGIVAGANALGLSQNYAGNMPLHILKVAGIEMTALGQKYKRQDKDQEILHLNPEKSQYVKLLHNNQILKGAIVLGVPGIGFRLEKLIKKQAPIMPVLSDLHQANWDVIKKYRP